MDSRTKYFGDTGDVFGHLDISYRIALGLRNPAEDSVSLQSLVSVQTTTEDSAPYSEAIPSFHLRLHIRPCILSQVLNPYKII
jgi:hypothetical protein